ncbi:Ig-like domain-containing protein [Planctomycetota bacterium]|nr:Ig-like domain-containing protein [Planctomycetota bacterium]
MKHFLLTFFIALAATVSSNAQTLQVDPIYIGEIATFEVQNGSPNSPTIICYSMNGSGPFSLSNGITLDLSMPIRNLNPFNLDSLGNGTLGPFPVPSNAVVGMQVWFQGVQLDMWATPIYSVTNMVPITVQNTPNNPPTAVDDNANTRESVAVTIDVMANDSDIDGDGISLFSVSTPANGIAVINGGVIDYTPNTLFSGLDSFTYQLQDAPGDQDTATVTVTVTANNSPVAVDDNAGVGENDVVLIDVLVNDSDPEGDAISIASVNTPTNGTALIINGHVEYTPLINYVGTDSFTYIIEDSFSAQATATVFVDVVDGGILTSWGRDDDDQVTDTPTGNDFIHISGGEYHSVALKSDGSLVSWGLNSSNQVTDTPSGNDFIQISGGYRHSVALKSDGSLVSWGLNASNQVTDTPSGNDFAQVAGGAYHSVALRSDGSLVSWGRDNYNQVTDTPPGLGFAQVSAGYGHSVAVRLDGTLVSWGWDGQGQVADNPSGNDFTQVSAGGQHSAALRLDGTLVSWGRNTDSQVSNTPAYNGFTQVAAGGQHSMAIRF